MWRTKSKLVLLSALLALAGNAQAQLGESCGEDVKRLCGDVAPGGGRVLNCLKEKQDQLSSPCTTHLGYGKRYMENWDTACGADKARLCPDVKLGDNRVLQCLQSHSDKLSDQCRTHVAVTKSVADTAKEACEVDGEKFCPGMKLGTLRMNRCLREHQGELSTPCRIRFELGSGYRGCTVDAARLCPNVAPGEGRVLQCLKANEASLSSACKDNMTSARSSGQTFRQACIADIRTHCKGLRPGGGRVLQCLKEKKAMLSPDCQNHL